MTILSSFAHSVDIVSSTAPAKTVRLINVHLESHYHDLHIKILVDDLREPGCGRGIMAGDFNAVNPEDEDEDGLEPSRVDKVAMLGLNAEEMEILRPGRIKIPRPGKESLEIPWSDHYGLRCTFTI
ncbi:hypothetical protein H2248_004417 [Termitomyces sp. 'cryptogamus']|nr:hypothetical protein H2248_004417 [Termitomyces sp. 'cryptogamus']